MSQPPYGAPPPGWGQPPGGSVPPPAVPQAPAALPPGTPPVAPPYASPYPPGPPTGAVPSVRPVPPPGGTLELRLPGAAPAGFGPPVPPSGGRRRGPSARAVVIASVVAAVALAGVGLFVSLGDGGGGEAFAGASPSAPADTGAPDDDPADILPDETDDLIPDAPGAPVEIPDETLPDAPLAAPTGTGLEAIWRRDGGGLLVLSGEPVEGGDGQQLYGAGYVEGGLECSGAHATVDGAERIALLCTEDGVDTGEELGGFIDFSGGDDLGIAWDDGGSDAYTRYGDLSQYGQQG
ncbi:hypothetical protein [Streptomyces sp. RFCAC02]|uniref:hypothetical protein n=1 Tax=Streptomyces sp. RFCAC02 TaxID=2499143 RepID=UPI0010221AB7|nr:hypothetical protein [Streptomyces sp. RFCAC02]